MKDFNYREDLKIGDEITYIGVVNKLVGRDGKIIGEDFEGWEIEFTDGNTMVAHWSSLTKKLSKLEKVLK